MKVLIGNFHNSDFGGGELYTYQVAKAVSTFAEILFIQQPNQNIWISNPDLRVEFSVWDNVEPVDHYVNISHFNTLICNTAKKNTLTVFFPNKKHKVAEYNHFVPICDFANKYAKEYWGVEGKVCRPYSTFPKSLVINKKPKTILSVGNFFKEPDGHSKNQHILIDAFKSLGKGWKLVLIGNVVSQAYYEELCALAKGLDVQIIPNADEPLKQAYLASAEFYWHANGYGRTDPYQSEHFGIAPEEALKAGCLTYVHASGGAQDFCKSWDTVAELISMTKNKVKNPENEFQTPELMEAFWRELLCTEN